VCQKLLHLVKAFERYKQKYALVSLFWTTRCLISAAEENESQWEAGL